MNKEEVEIETGKAVIEMKRLITQLKKKNAGLKEQLKKLLDFAAERTEMCDVCPLTETCRNSEGTCPYAALDEEKATRKWLKQYIKGRK